MKPVDILRTLRWQLRRLAAQARQTTYGPVNVAQGVWDDVVDWFNGLALSENSILLGFAVVIGLAAAFGVIGFYKLIDLAHEIFFSWPETYLPELGQLAYRPILTGVGAVAAWWVMRRFAPGQKGLTIPDVQLAVVRRQGVIPSRAVMVRTAASAITIGSGGSAGAEGPIAVFGAAVGSRLGRSFRFSGNRTIILVGAGAAAGISAAFNAPLAGAFFALEEILGSFSIAAFAPVVVSSVVAAVVSRSVFGNHPVFPVPFEQGYGLTREVLLFYPLLGLLAGLASVAFVRFYFGVDSWAERFRKRMPVLLALAGGAAVGGLAFFSSGLLVGFGHLAIPLDRFDDLAWYLLIALAGMKIIATSITLNTGGSGGLFTPSLYVGATGGAAFGAVLIVLFPGAEPVGRALCAGGHGGGGRGGARRADDGDPDGLGDDRQFGHHVATDAGGGGEPLRGAAAGGRLALQRMAAAAGRTHRARDRPRRARKPARGGGVPPEADRHPGTHPRDAVPDPPRRGDPGRLSGGDGVRGVERRADRRRPGPHRERAAGTPPAPGRGGGGPGDRVAGTGGLAARGDTEDGGARRFRAAGGGPGIRAAGRPPAPQRRAESVREDSGRGTGGGRGQGGDPSDAAEGAGAELERCGLKCVSSGTRRSAAFRLSRIHPNSWGGTA